MGRVTRSRPIACSREATRSWTGTARADMLAPMAAEPSLWQRIYEEFAPEEPARAPERAERQYSPVGTIADSLRRPFGDKKFLITGSVGTGKTTELHRIGEGQSERFVVLLDVYAHFESTILDPHAINNLQSWELIFLIGLAIHRAASTQLGHQWSPEVTRALHDAAAKLQESDEADDAMIDVATLASSVVVSVGGALVGGPAGAAAGNAALKLVEGVGKAVNWTLPIGRKRREPRSDQDGHVRAMLGAVNEAIGELRRKYRDVLVLLDGLDRIKDRENIEALFVRSSLLADLACPTVAIAPITVRRDHMARVRGFEAKDLVNVPVVDREKYEFPSLGPGVGFFHELMTLRLDKLGLTEMAPFTRAQIDRMAWCSGGRARDFVTLVRGVAERAYDGAVTKAKDLMIEQAVDEARRKKESGLNKDEIALLRAQLMDERRALPGGDIAIALLDRQQLIPYPNESTWYFPHPLLTLNLVTRT